MNRLLVSIIVTALCVILFAGQAGAQYSDDALRYSYPGLGVGARALGLGTAYTGVADDFSAVYWNPAGLGQMQLNEISLGLSHVSYGNDATFLGNQQSITNSNTAVNSVGAVYAYPTTQGSLVFAIGYDRQTDFTTGLSFSGFNPTSSMIQYWAPDGVTITPYKSIPEYLNLAYVDSIDPNTIIFNSPIKDSLQQTGTVFEGGGLNYVSFAAAVEASRNLYFGLTLNFVTGSYSYSRDYAESDVLNHYQTFPFDFSQLTLNQTVQADLSGFTAKLGMLYRLSPKARLGIAVKLPTWMTVKETFTEQATSTFDNGDMYTYPVDGGASVGTDEYDVKTPFTFSAGLSYTAGDAMFTGDIEYTDWTEMEFSNSDVDLLSLNNEIKTRFQATANLRGGIEYNLSDAGVKVRGGFAYLPSPYNGDPSSFAQKFITAGLGFVIENAVAIDIGYAYGFWDTNHEVYPGVNTTVENIHTHNVLTTVSYRF